MEGEIVGRETVPGLDGQAITVGPDEVLIVHTPRMMGAGEVEMHRRQYDQVLGRDRYIILMGDWQLSKVSIAGAQVLRTNEIEER